MGQEHDSQLCLKSTFLDQALCKNLPEDELHFSKIEIKCMVDQPVRKQTHSQNDTWHALHFH